MSEENIIIDISIAELGVSVFKNSQNFHENERMIDKLSLLSDASNTLLSEYKKILIKSQEKFFINLK